MAPSTPPPPSNVRLAALTMASAPSVVMSATQTSSRVGPIAAPPSEEILAIRAGTRSSLSCPFGLRFGAQIDRALHADIVKVLVEEMPRRALAADVEHVKEVVIVRKSAVRVEMRAEAIEHDAMHIDGAIFGKQRGVEGDLVDPIHDLARRHRGRLPHQRIDLHHNHIFSRGRAEE